MPKKPCVRTLLGSQHVKGTKTLLKSARQYFCHIFWSLWKEISSKNSVLVVFEISRLFVHILTPDEKYSLPVKVFNGTNSNATISKSKNIFWSFFYIYGIYINLEYIEQKDQPWRWFFYETINCKKRK